MAMLRMRATRNWKRATALSALVSLVGCDAQLGWSGADSNGGPRGDGDSLHGDPDEPRECPPSIGQDLVLLGELAFVNSIKALVGDEVVVGRLTPEAETKTFSQKGLVANTSLVSTRLDWAEHAAAQLEGRSVEVTGCTPDDTACAREYIARFARQAFRRPVDEIEIDDLMAVFSDGAETSFENGIQLALQAILISPSFNHRTEYGTLQEDGSYRLTPHEIASALSYMLSDSLPDSELAGAADLGSLADPEEIIRQTERLLQDEEVQDSVEKTLMSAWNLGNIFGTTKDPGIYPQFSGTLAAQMYHETELFLKDHLWDPSRGISSVLTSRSTYVNADLAALYGVPFAGSSPTEFTRVDLPLDQRAGLFTQASFLTMLSRTDTTSVVARGLFINGPLLCFPKIDSPPEDAIADLEEQLAADLTERERAAHRAETSPCKNCHAHFDAFGLLLETYDAIGQFDPMPDGVAADTGVEVTNKGPLDGYYSDAVSFMEEAAQGPEFAQCVTRHLLAYATGEDGIARNDCEVTNATLDYTPQTTLKDVILAVVQADEFSRRTGETAP